MPPGRHWILINRIALHGYIKFGLALFKAAARWARGSERSRSASATVGRCLEFNSHVVPGMQELAALQFDETMPTFTPINHWRKLPLPRAF